ncbi:MAG: hypothetical protein WDO18_04705 [Acidobacteriota bacterium]
MKIFVWIAVLLVLGVGAWKLVEWRNQPPEITFIRATRGPIASEVSTNGRVDPSESADARTETSRPRGDNLRQTSTTGQHR